MNGEAVNAILDAAKKPEELGGLLVVPNNWLAIDPVSVIKPGPRAEALKVATLGAVRDYLAANKDALDLSRLAVHIASPNLVSVLGPLDARARVRETYLAASVVDLTDGFIGKFMSLTEFVVGLQVRFVKDGERDALLRLFSSVKHESVKTSMDDGISQTVQAKNGVVLVSDVAVPNPVALSGYRAFRDVQQASSLYVLRVQDGRAGGLPEVGLFEADGGAWRLWSIQRVREWLIENLPAGPSILG